jgi:hypothetical protein
MDYQKRTDEIINHCKQRYGNDPKFTEWLKTEDGKKTILEFVRKVMIQEGVNTRHCILQEFLGSSKDHKIF